MITIIRDYEQKAIDTLISEYEKLNEVLEIEHKTNLFDKLFYCLRENNMLPKVEGIKISHK